MDGLTADGRRLWIWSPRRRRHGLTRCACCQRDLPRDAFPRWMRAGIPWACRLCFMGYMRFRRAFRRERGRWPTTPETRVLFLSE